jgi:hypothetical protein
MSKTRCAFVAPAFASPLVFCLAGPASPQPPWRKDDDKELGNLLTMEQKFFLAQVRMECKQYTKKQLEEKLLEALTLMLRKDTLLKSRVFRWADYTGE